MIRPTTIPQTPEGPADRAGGRPRGAAPGLRASQVAGARPDRRDADKNVGQSIFDQKGTGQTLVNMLTLDMIVGSGGVLSHAPHRAQSALMMLDAYQPEGVTMLAVDSIFMMPQLGVLSTVPARSRHAGLRARLPDQSREPASRRSAWRKRASRASPSSGKAASKIFRSGRCACFRIQEQGTGNREQQRNPQSAIGNRQSKIPTPLLLRPLKRSMWARGGARRLRRRFRAALSA